MTSNDKSTSSQEPPVLHRPAPLNLLASPTSLTLHADIGVCQTADEQSAGWGMVMQLGSLRLEARRRLCPVHDARMHTPLRGVLRATHFVLRLANNALPLQTTVRLTIAIRAPTPYLARAGACADIGAHAKLRERIRSEVWMLAGRNVEVVFVSPAQDDTDGVARRARDLAALGTGRGEMIRCLKCPRRFDSTMEIAQHVREMHEDVFESAAHAVELFELKTPCFSGGVRFREHITRNWRDDVPET